MINTLFISIILSFMISIGTSEDKLYLSYYIVEYSEYDTEDGEFYIAAIIAAESAFNEKATSSAKAQGLMQLTSIAIKEITNNKLCGIDSPPINVYDVAVNIKLGSCFFKHLTVLYDGNRILALAHYNGGGRAATRLRKKLRPFPETADYITKVVYYVEIMKKKKKELKND